MAKDASPARLPHTPDLASFPRRRALGMFVVTVLLLAGGFALVRWSLRDGQAAGSGQRDGDKSFAFVAGEKNNSEAPKLFVGWTKPDFALILTGQTFGYLQPCGCSFPQYGGLARR